MDPATITVVATVVAIGIGQMAATAAAIEGVREEIRGLRSGIDALTARVDRLYDRRPDEAARPGDTLPPAAATGAK